MSISDKARRRCRCWPVEIIGLVCGSLSCEASPRESVPDISRDLLYVCSVFVTLRWFANNFMDFARSGIEYYNSTGLFVMSSAFIQTT